MPPSINDVESTDGVYGGYVAGKGTIPSSAAEVVGDGPL